MITEQTLLPILTDINPNTKTISCAIDTIVLKDSVEIARTRDRRAFVPGEIEQFKQYVGATSSPEIDYLNAIWTADVISAYQQSLLNDENN